MTSRGRVPAAALRIAGWALAAVAVVVLAWFAWVGGHILWWRWNPPVETAFMAQRLDELRAKDPKAKLRYTWVPYDRISPHLKRAMIAAEDAKFVDHDGFDWDGIRKAMEKNEPARPRRRRRVDDLPAAREEPVPVAGEDVHAQGAGGGDHAAARGAAAQAADLRALPQRHRVGQRRVRRRGGGAALLRRPRGEALGPSRRRDSPRWRPARACSSATPARRTSPTAPRRSSRGCRRRSCRERAALTAPVAERRRRRVPHGAAPRWPPSSSARRIRAAEPSAPIRP